MADCTQEVMNNFDKLSKSKVNTKPKNHRKLKKSMKMYKNYFSKMKYNYNVDSMSMEDLRESLVRVEKNPMEPFSFLMNITEDVNDTKTSKSNFVEISNSTDIDIEMATLLQRIQLNKSLLEQANDGVKTFNSFVKKKIEDNKDKEISSSVLEENYPPIDEMQRICKLTIENLNKMKDNFH